jgi:isoleucyl-tRNA synthetase
MTENNTQSLYDVQIGLSVLFECLFQFSLGIAPFAPFLSEIIYQSLKSQISEEKHLTLFKDSIHFERLPTLFYHTIDTNMDLSMTCLIRVVNLVRHQRSTREKFQSIKMPYQKVILVNEDTNILQALKSVEHILKDEVNIIDIEYQDSMSGWVDYNLLPNLKVLGPKLGNEIKAFIKYLPNVPKDEIDQWVEDKQGPFYWYDRKIDREDIIVKTSPKKEFSTWQVVSDNDLVVLIDPEITDSLLSTYYLKQFTRQAQDFRRKNGLVLGDYAILHYSDITDNKYFTTNFIDQNLDQIEFLVGKIESDINQVDLKTMKKVAECQLLLDTERNGKNDPNSEKITLSLFIES